MSDTKVSKNNNKILRLIRGQALVIGLIVVFLFFSVTTDTFLSSTNMILIMQQASILGIAACAMTFVLITANLDLSMGAIITLSVLLSVDLHDKLGTLPAILIAVAMCLLMGLINGLLVAFLEVHSMIATLGIQIILSGVMLLYTGGQLTWVDNPAGTWFKYFGREKIGPIPVQVLILIAMVIIFEFILRKTSFGVKVYASGGNPRATTYSGINSKLVILSCFILSAAMAALAGLVMGSRIMKYQTEVAFGYEFDVISAVVLGGTSLSGGRGDVGKSIIGVLIVSTLNNGLLIYGLPYYFQWIVQGIIILVVVFFDIQSLRKEGLA